MKLQQSICLTAALLVLDVTGATLKAGEPTVNPTGTWKWVAPANPDGRIPDITFTLKLEGETLAGTRTTGTGTATVTNALINGVFKGDEVSFHMVREGHAGKSTNTYSGKLSGDTIKGRQVIDARGVRGILSDYWEVKRVNK